MSGLSGVLVVDDEMLIRQGIINYINWEQEGFRIVGEASNGKEALQLIDDLRPHVIITDIVMPGMDGIELVRIVKEQYPAIEIIVLSSFENFDYVRSTFQSGVADYILKPKLNGEELIKTLRKIVPKPVNTTEEVKENPVSIEKVLKKHIQGYALTSSEEMAMEGFPYNHYSLAAVCNLEQKEHILSVKEMEQQFIHIEALITPINVSDNNLMLLNFDADHLPAVKQSLINLAEQYRKLNADTCLLMSVPFSSIHEVKAVYDNHLLKMKDYLFYLTEEPVLIYDALPAVVKTKQSFQLSQFIDCFKQKKFEAAIQSLKEHVDLLTHNYTKDIFEFKSWLENIIFNVVVLLGNMKYDTEELEAAKYEYFADINEAHQAKEAVARFYDFLEVVQQLVLVNDRENCPPNMRRLLDYIEEHYAEPLSLTALAEHFHFNPSYLSSYFSTHLKIGFSDYLNQVRIAKAKHILKSSSASISTVSEMVGYSEPSYFCKVFKRIEGSSPGSYRKKAAAMNWG